MKFISIHCCIQLFGIAAKFVVISCSFQNYMHITMARLQAGSDDKLMCTSRLQILKTNWNKSMTYIKLLSIAITFFTILFVRWHWIHVDYKVCWMVEHKMANLKSQKPKPPPALIFASHELIHPLKCTLEIFWFHILYFAFQLIARLQFASRYECFTIIKLIQMKYSQSVHLIASNAYWNGWMTIIKWNYLC